MCAPTKQTVLWNAVAQTTFVLDQIFTRVVLWFYNYCTNHFSLKPFYLLRTITCMFWTTHEVYTTLCRLQDFKYATRSWANRKLEICMYIYIKKIADWFVLVVYMVYKKPRLADGFTLVVYVEFLKNFCTVSFSLYLSHTGILLVFYYHILALLLNTLFCIMSIMYFLYYVYYVFTDTQCGLDNGGCSHFCHPTKDGHAVCSCPAKMALATDRTTCCTVCMLWLMLLAISHIYWHCIEPKLGHSLCKWILIRCNQHAQDKRGQIYV